MRTIGDKKLYEARSEVAKALSHPTRLKIVDLLAEEKKLCVQDFTDRLETSQSTTSKHLKILLQAGVVGREKSGLKNYYSLEVPCIAGFFDCLDQILRGKYLDKQDELNLG
ncbi:ArsR/SmtB family transcription factor [Halarsenatibacter silvermanii]|uniref:Transcriptional regulator, ArsR family n=1 Tax=Halarsenatibacter silvermanii TaxID=321763 RepID=A0A1G9TUD8_9FIRM|nr:metalloregulator ArsR/SmtB family transcription factor [Halarsenatibacter silvermanii]SDM51252.1 transcriptional regulator, ArsR family [Halarsenatibacter silvermanii]